MTVATPLSSSAERNCQRDAPSQLAALKRSDKTENLMLVLDENSEQTERSVCSEFLAELQIEISRSFITVLPRGTEADRASLEPQQLGRKARETCIQSAGVGRTKTCAPRRPSPRDAGALGASAANCRKTSAECVRKCRAATNQPSGRRRGPVQMAPSTE